MQKSHCVNTDKEEGTGQNTHCVNTIDDTQDENNQERAERERAQTNTSRQNDTQTELKRTREELRLKQEEPDRTSPMQRLISSKIYDIRHTTPTTQQKNRYVSGVKSIHQGTMTSVRTDHDATPDTLYECCGCFGSRRWCVSITIRRHVTKKKNRTELKLVSCVYQVSPFRFDHFVVCLHENVTVTCNHQRKHRYNIAKKDVWRLKSHTGVLQNVPNLVTKHVRGARYHNYVETVRTNKQVLVVSVRLGPECVVCLCLSLYARSVPEWIRLPSILLPRGQQMLKGDCGDPHEHMALRRPYQGILSLRNGDSPLQKLTGPGPQKPKETSARTLAIMAGSERRSPDYWILEMESGKRHRLS